MAVDSATLSTASGILKEVYQPGIVDQINNPNALMAEVEKTSKDIIEGKYAVIALRMGVSQGIGARAELGTLPSAQRTLVVQSRALLKFLYGVIRVSGPFLESSRTDRASFIRGLRSESEGITEAMKLDLNRQLYGDGSGQVAVCGVSGPSLTVTLDADANMLYFEEGMIVDIRTSATGTAVANGTNREVVSINVTAKTITLDTAGGTVTVTAAESVYRAGNRNNEITGLGLIVSDTGTLQNVDPTVSGNTRWKARVNSAFGVLTLAKIQDEFDRVHDASGEWVSHLFSNKGPRNKYLELLNADRRYMPQEATKTLNGGFKGLSYTGGGTEAVWVKDPYSPDRKIFGVTMKRLEWRRLKDFEFMEVGGSAWLPDIYGASAADAYKAVLASYAELITTRRNAHFRADAVTV